MYNGSKIPTLGTAELLCSKNDSKYLIRFHVVQNAASPIIGCATSLNCNFIQITDYALKQVNSIHQSDILDEYKDVFSGTGTLGDPYEITLDDKVIPIVLAPRRVPISLLKDLQRKLQQLEKRNLIQKVSDPTEWVSHLVIVRKKNGSLRLCIDPHYLNKAIKRPHY